MRICTWLFYRFKDARMLWNQVRSSKASRKDPDMDGGATEREEVLGQVKRVESEKGQLTPKVDIGRPGSWLSVSPGREANGLQTKHCLLVAKHSCEGTYCQLGMRNWESILQSGDTVLRTIMIHRAMRPFLFVAAIHLLPSCPDPHALASQTLDPRV